jgi:hypothetical protein
VRSHRFRRVLPLAVAPLLLLALPGCNSLGPAGLGPRRRSDPHPGAGPASFRQNTPNGTQALPAGAVEGAAYAWSSDIRIVSFRAPIRGITLRGPPPTTPRSTAAPPKAMTAAWSTSPVRCWRTSWEPAPCMCRRGPTITWRSPPAAPRARITRISRGASRSPGRPTTPVPARCSPRAAERSWCPSATRAAGGATRCRSRWWSAIPPARRSPSGSTSTFAIWPGLPSAAPRRPAAGCRGAARGHGRWNRSGARHCPISAPAIPTWREWWTTPPPRDRALPDQRRRDHRAALSRERRTIRRRVQPALLRGGRGGQSGLQRDTPVDQWLGNGDGSYLLSTYGGSGPGGGPVGHYLVMPGFQRSTHSGSATAQDSHPFSYAAVRIE